MQISLKKVQWPILCPLREKEKPILILRGCNCTCTTPYANTKVLCNVNVKMDAIYVFRHSKKFNFTLTGFLQLISSYAMQATTSRLLVLPLPKALD